jgi:hypothetical protein
MSDLIKYPRTQHLWNPELVEFLRERQKSLGISKPMEDKMISRQETDEVLRRNDVTYVWESKLDGTNIGISFVDGKIFLQNRGHEIKTGEHVQYNLFRNWAYTVMPYLEAVLNDRYILYGEWLFAVHTVVYKTLPHYLFEFDVWDKQESCFLDTAKRTDILNGLIYRNMLQQVPVVHIGRLSYEDARKLVNHKPYFGEEKPEGLYLKIEKDGKTIGRYKFVRPDFVQQILEDNESGVDHWRHRPVVQQGLVEGVDIMAPDFS